MSIDSTAGMRSDGSLQGIARRNAYPSRRSLGALLLLAVMWGLSIPVTKLGLATMPPLTLTALRFAVAVPLLFLFLVGRQRLPLRAFPRVAALGILGIGVGQVTQTLGVAGTSASAGTIISATIPVFIVIFAALRLKQAVSGRQTLGLLAAFIGIALVASGNGGEAAVGSKTTLAGVGLLLLSALTIAFYYVWSIELTNSYGTATVAAWSSFTGFVVLLPWAGWEMWRVPFHLTAQAIGAGAYLGVVVTAAGLFLWLHLLRIVPARSAAGVQYLQPVVGVTASAAMFGDKLGLLFVAGVILVLAGLALSMASRNKGAGELQASP
jgi:drug/metabolite transporter (DMT)-like permease